MKFSNDAMRDALLFFEEKISYEKHGISDKKVKKSFNLNNVVKDEYFVPLFKKHKYTEDELYYTIEKMIEGGILQASGSLNSHYQVFDISYEGLQLLEEIRLPSTWKKTKEIANKLGNCTVGTLGTIAQNITINAIPNIISNFLNSQ